MPNANLHQIQARHNKKFLSEAVFDLKKNKYPDWYVTACFYYVLHLVDKKLSEIDSKYNNFGGHEKRRELVNNVLVQVDEELPDYYKMIESYSQTARYRCETITPIIIKKVIFCTEWLERTLTKTGT